MWLLCRGSAALPRPHPIPAGPGLCSSPVLVPPAGAHPVLPVLHLLWHHPLPGEPSAFPAIISSPGSLAVRWLCHGAAPLGSCSARLPVPRQSRVVLCRGWKCHLCGLPGDNVPAALGPCVLCVPWLISTADNIPDGK